ncbi:MAG TPA: alpha/beta hydrolase, partial [Pyrinomonadaceae bacterium]|nr:alpha/beta hydrolase [Pyrinomonadaceae bacterium]
TSHQPGAQHAIAAFMSGYLNCDMSAAFSRLVQPMVLVWGKQDVNTPVSKASALLSLNPRARLEVFDFCRVLPEQEHPEKFNALAREWFMAQSYKDQRDVRADTKYRAAGE